MPDSDGFPLLKIIVQVISTLSTSVMVMDLGEDGPLLCASAGEDLYCMH